MECNHCRTNFHAVETEHKVGEDENRAWVIVSIQCPACRRPNLYLVLAIREGTILRPDGGQQAWLKPVQRDLIWPRTTKRTPCPHQVPPAIAEDYTEACLVLADSPKASAALSRRCLQAILRDAAKVKHNDLVKEIDEALNSPGLPTHIRDTIDAVRQVGNFAAHPIKSQATGQIVPVEPHEAEWNLDTLEALFDFYYVQPDTIARKRSVLDAKLKDAGKKPMK